MQIDLRAGMVYMYRLLSFIVITGFVFTMLYLHQQNSHFGKDAHAGHSGQHKGLEISNIKEVQIPEIDGRIKQDITGSWMLKLITKNFSFEPEKIDSGEQQINGGHAHLYINGDKKNRIYGHYYDLGSFKPGVYEIKVTLNTNNHEVLMYNNEEIAFQYKLSVEN